MGVVEAVRARLARNFEEVEGRICEACARAGRERAGVRLIAVSKAADAAAVAGAFQLGQLDFGENYVRPAQVKMRELAALGVAGARFHMIGHLQRNKVRDALRAFRSLHSLDSGRLLESLEREAAGTQAGFPCFVEVNASGEAGKYGVGPEDAPGLVEAGMKARGVEVVGLMTMAPYAAEPGASRPSFARLRELGEKMREIFGRGTLPYLSMGMSGDFEVAVEEGATHLRIGSALFGK